MINIYDLDGNILMQAELTKDAKREEEMSKSDYIQLSFNAAVKVVLPVGAYIEYAYHIDSVREVTRNFLLLEPYEPTQNDEMSWKYTPEFQHPKMVLGKIPFYINTKNSQNKDVKQTVWDFVGTPTEIMDKFCDFLNNKIVFGNHGWTARVVGEVKNSLTVSFSDNDVMSALSSTANAMGDNCEWHIDYDNEIIYIGEVVYGETPYLLRVGQNIGVSSVNESKENYYNCFTIFGGTRNISQPNSQGENISSGDIRLQLAKGEGKIDVDGQNISYTIDDFSTIELRKNKNECQLTKVLNFADIFPSLNTYVYNVRGREKYVIDSTTNKKVPLTYNTDGSVAKYRTFTVWYMRLAYCTKEKIEGKEPVNTTTEDGNALYWYDFEITDDLLISGKTLSCSFEANTKTGALPTPLAGRGTNGDYVGFELSYHKNATTSHDSDDVSNAGFDILAGDYEIIYQEENSLIVPTNASEMLVPKGETLPSLLCNITVLYNIAMSDVYTSSAQQELLNVALKEIRHLYSDKNNYTNKSYPHVFAENNPYLQIGQRVMYDDGEGYKFETRVIKLSTNIDYNFIQEITVGNQAIKGTITQLKEDVQSIITGNESSGNVLTAAQINNIIARYCAPRYLSRIHEDTAQKAITFMEGLRLGADNSGYSIGADGSAVLGDVVVDRVHDAASTEQGRQIVGAQGFDLYMGADGRSHMWLDYLTVRTRMFAAEMEIRKVSYSGGTTIMSNAGSRLAKVAYVMDSGGEKVVAYKCWAVADDGTTQTMNWWKPGMMALSQTFNVKAGTTQSAGNRRYWRLVVAVGQERLEDGKLYDWVVLSNVAEFGGGDAVVPTYGVRLLADEGGRVLTWGGAAVGVAAMDGYASLAAMASAELGVEKDDGGTAIAGRVFYGYEPTEDGGEPDAPRAGDVIVQVGDEIRWRSMGNVIRLSTSAEDGDGDSVPSVAMYHGIGALRGTGKKGTDGKETASVWQWKQLTCVLSPEQVLMNSANFKWFSGSVDNVIDPVPVWYEMVTSTDTFVARADGTVAPEEIEVRVAKHMGSKQEWLKDFYVGIWWEMEDGTENDDYLIADGEAYIEGISNYDPVPPYFRFVWTHPDDKTIQIEKTVVRVADGSKGDKGDAGADGKPGKDGADGKDGEKGDPGKDGTNGKDGADGQPGKDGADGKDAMEIWTDPGTITLEAKSDENGNAKADCTTGNTAQIHMFRNGSELAVADWSPKIYATDGCTATVSTKGQVSVSAVATDGIDGRKISRTSASVTVELYREGMSYLVTIPIQVSVSAVWGSMVADQKTFQTKYNEITTELGTDVEQMKADITTVNGKADSASTKADAASTKADNASKAASDAQEAVNKLPLKSDADLVKYTSSITQTARNIALKVGQTVVGRKNLFVGSALRRRGEGADISSAAGSGLAWGGYGGRNAFRAVVGCPGGTQQWLMVANGNSGRAPGNIRIQKGTTYTISCWARGATGLRFMLQAWWKAAAMDARGLRKGSIGSDGLTVTSATANAWHLLTLTVSIPQDAAYDYMEVCAVATHSVADATKVGYISEVMVTEGDEYAGYTLSEQDYDYIGGNMLDGTRAMQNPSGGNMSVVPKDVTQDGYGSDSAVAHVAASSTAYAEVAQWLLMKGATPVLELGEDYTLRFVAKGTGMVNCFMFGGSGSGTQSLWVDKAVGGMTYEGYTTGDGYAAMPLGDAWTEYAVHWRAVGTLVPRAVLIRCPAGSEIWVARPKLEVGATPTAWTDSKTGYTEDRAMGAKMLETGLDIENRKITLTADTTVLRTNAGKEVAVFDESGLNADLVRAKRLETSAVGGASVRIENGLLEVFGANGVANIRFGVDADGNAVLSYYNNAGVKLYDLGPSGLGELEISSGQLTQTDMGVSATSAMWSMTTFKAGSMTYQLAVVTNTWEANLFSGNVRTQPFANGSKAATLYQYTAGRLNGTVQADSTYNLTQALATEADGKYFTSAKISDGTKLVNLATGVYIEKTAYVLDAPEPLVASGSASVEWPAKAMRVVWVKNGSRDNSVGEVYSQQTKMVGSGLEM